MGDLKEWIAQIKAYKARIKAVETLSKEELEDLDFMEQKLADWRTD